MVTINLGIDVTNQDSPHSQTYLEQNRTVRIRQRTESLAEMLSLISNQCLSHITATVEENQSQNSKFLSLFKL